jgi:predicted HicB family RNase H-like nuclease
MVRTVGANGDTMVSLGVTKVSVSLDDEAMEAARSAANAEGISLSAWLSRAAKHAAGVGRVRG